MKLFNVVSNRRFPHCVSAETITNVLDFKREAGLWHGVLTVSGPLPPVLTAVWASQRQGAGADTTVRREMEAPPSGTVVYLGDL